MDNNTVEEITDEMLAAEAAEEALQTEGVFSLLPGITDTIQGNLLRKAIDAPGIKMNRDGESVSFDITLMTEYGYNIPSVAWDVQERIKKRVEQSHGLTVDVVNVHVQKIHFREQVEENEQKTGQRKSHEIGL